MSTTHVAGPVVSIGDRIIQRCAICGDKLVDNINKACVARPGDHPIDIGVWREGCLVQVVDLGDGCERAVDTGDFGITELLPGDFCLALVEE